MVEWYPGVLCISTLHPLGPNKTRNIVEFYYPEEIVLFEREFVKAERAAYMETCTEDDEIAERMDAGRAALLARGVNEVGPIKVRWKMVCNIFMSGIAGRCSFNWAVLIRGRLFFLADSA
jgi:phenylpropionate dioxygenase-like ring-hydroxylating dioxygenase large terminal subunit